MDTKTIPRLHFITHSTPQHSWEQMITAACNAGIPCVQLRMKDAPYDDVLHTAEMARKITHKYNTTLIINDYVDIAKIVQADGVHLGNTDLSHHKARALLGNEIIIGATANNLMELEQHLDCDCDYIGYGPYTATTTKRNAAQPLGLNAYYLLEKYRIKKPIIAIGGITIQDIAPLQLTPIHGIAMSSGILQGDIDKNIKDILRHLYVL